MTELELILCGLSAALAASLVASRLQARRLRRQVEVAARYVPYDDQELLDAVRQLQADRQRQGAAQ